MQHIIQNAKKILFHKSQIKSRWDHQIVEMKLFGASQMDVISDPISSRALLYIIINAFQYGLLICLISESLLSVKLCKL